MLAPHGSELCCYFIRASRTVGFAHLVDVPDVAAYSVGVAVAVAVAVGVTVGVDVTELA